MPPLSAAASPQSNTTNNNTKNIHNSPKQYQATPPPITTKTTSPSFLDDCDRPACDDMVSMLKAASDRVHKNKKDERKSDQQEEQQQQQQPSIPSSSSSSTDCPPNSAKLGRSSWTLLHSMAAWYPDKPSKQDQSQIKQFFVALARFYPCPWCASDFSNKIQEKPIQTETRKDLCVWLCEQHNMVNEKLGKPLFSCNIKELDERWRRSSHPECSNNNNNYYTQQRKQQQQDAEERE